jgi:hypothetical protein
MSWCYDDLYHVIHVAEDVILSLSINSSRLYVKYLEWRHLII